LFCSALGFADRAVDSVLVHDVVLLIAGRKRA
jgi:hypothetical protein